MHVSLNHSLHTAPAADPPAWTLKPIAEIVISLLVVLSNGFLLLLFGLYRHLFSPFKVYMISLLIINVLYDSVNTPLDIMNSVYPTWRAGSTGCSIYIYAIRTLAGIQMHSHLLIAINRLWAILHPISYRNSHNAKTALLTCAGMWLYIHVVTLPGFILDAAVYRLPLEYYPCFLNFFAQMKSEITIEVIIYDIPILFMILSFFFLTWFRRRQKRMVRAGHTHGTLATGDDAGFPARHATVAPSHVSQTEKVTEKRKGSENNRAFALLAFLTVSVTICWSSGVMYFTAVLFRQDLPILWLQLAAILWPLQSLFDPFLFLLAFKDIRDAAKRLLQNSH